MTQKWILALALSVGAMPAFAQLATPTNFTPVVMSEEAPLRFFANLNSAMRFKNGVSTALPDGRFDIMNAQLNLGLVYSVGMGLDVGLGVHGGVFSPYGMFRDTTGLPAPLKQYGVMFGADFMVRYLAMLTDMFYAGLQAQVGYDYTDVVPGLADASYPKSKTETNSFIPVVAGIVLGADFAGAASVYLFPALEMGQTPKATGYDGGVWKNALGMQIAIGTAINLGGTKLVLEAKPRMANFDDKNSWGMDATLGAFWDF